MPKLFNQDEFHDRKAMMLKILNENKIPHIQVEVLHDTVGKEGSPVSELAGLFEFLVNTLIGDVVLGNNKSAVTLLEHIKRGVDSDLFLMASLMDDMMEERKEAFGKREEEEEEEQTEIPDVFNEVLEQIQRKGEA